MIDMDLAQATFEYILRKKRNEGKLPADKSCILSDGHYYVVDWCLNSYEVWNKLVIDESALYNLDEKEMEKLFNSLIDNFIANIKITDPKDPESEKKLSDLKHWEVVKSIPKRYFKI